MARLPARETGGSSFENSYDERHHDYGLAPQDIRHRLVVSYIYDLPFGYGKRFVNHSNVADAVIGGWSVDGVTAFQAGSPVAMYQTCNRANTDSGTARPDVVGNWRLSTDRSDTAKSTEYFNTAAFVNVCPDLNGPGPFSFLADRTELCDRAWSARLGPRHFPQISIEGRCDLAAVPSGVL